MPTVFQVPAARFPRWVENFQRDRTGLAWGSMTHFTGLYGRTDDGSWFTATLPFAGPFEYRPGEIDPVRRFVAEVTSPPEWGVLLVRKGGFAVARLAGPDLVEHKVGQRHVQGRTKAGGQSQQRFARRRENQARQAYEAAAGHAARILDGLPDGVPLVTCGDATALTETIQEARLDRLHEIRLPGSIADPRRAVLDDVVRRAQCVQVQVHNA